MRGVSGFLAVAAALGLVTTAAAESVRLAPPVAQPAAGALKPGLAVRYGFPGDIRSLLEAETWRTHTLKPGPALVGFDYPDTNPGDKVLTSDVAELLVAFIDGFIRFDRPGTWRLEFHSNDGLSVKFGGREVYRHDGRHPCESAGWVEVEVPAPGWYPIEALYFQRRQTACLLLKWQAPGGGPAWTPNEAFAFRP
jgi:hypothetical protein